MEPFIISTEISCCLQTAKEIGKRRLWASNGIDFADFESETHTFDCVIKTDGISARLQMQRPPLAAQVKVLNCLGLPPT